MTSLIVVLGTFSNALTIVVYLRNRKLQTTFNHFITNLCVVDLFFCLLVSFLL